MQFLPSIYGSLVPHFYYNFLLRKGQRHGAFPIGDINKSVGVAVIVGCLGGWM